MKKIVFLCLLTALLGLINFTNCSNAEPQLNINGKEVQSMNQNRVAVFDTNMGTFTIELFEDKAPITTANFIKLAQ